MDASRMLFVGSDSLIALPAALSCALPQPFPLLPAAMSDAAAQDVKVENEAPAASASPAPGAGDEFVIGDFAGKKKPKRKKVATEEAAKPAEGEAAAAASGDASAAAAALESAALPSAAPTPAQPQEVGELAAGETVDRDYNYTEVSDAPLCQYFDRLPPLERGNATSDGSTDVRIPRACRTVYSSLVCAVFSLSGVRLFARCWSVCSRCCAPRIPTWPSGNVTSCRRRNWCAWEPERRCGQTSRRSANCQTTRTSTSVAATARPCPFSHALSVYCCVLFV
jgi:hypothetical protein